MEINSSNQRIQHVSKGQEFAIKATDWNKIADAVNKSAAALRNGHPEQALAPTPSQDGLITLRNDTGGDLDAFSIVDVFGVIWDVSAKLEEVKEEAWYIAETPDSTGRATAILTEPVKDGEMGEARLMGVSYCTCDIVSTSHRFVDKIAGNTDRLVTVEEGGIGKLLYEDGTGIGDALILLTNAGGAGGGVVEETFERAINSVVYNGSQPTTQIAEGAYGTVVIPYFAEVSDSNPTSFNDWRNTFWVNGASGPNQTPKGGFIIDATGQQGASITLKYVAPKNDGLAIFVYDIATLSTADDETGSLDVCYHALMQRMRGDLQTYQGGNTSTNYAVTAVDQGLKTFELAAATEVTFLEGSQFEIQGSTGNDQFFTMAQDSTWSAGTLTAVVEEAIPDPTADGDAVRYSGVLCRAPIIECIASGFTVSQSTQYRKAQDNYVFTEQDIAVPKRNGRSIRIDIWGAFSRANPEVIPTSLHPEGCLQCRWAGQSNPNGLEFIYKHHITGQLYKGSVNYNSTLSGGGGPTMNVQIIHDSNNQELNINTQFGIDGVDSDWNYLFDNPTVYNI